MEPAVRIRFEGAYDAENDEFVSQERGSQCLVRRMARRLANAGRATSGSSVFFICALYERAVGRYPWSADRFWT